MKKIALALLLMLLLPSAVAASGFKVNKLKKFQQPANTIDRVSKRTLTSKTFEADSIGSGKFTTIISAAPMHYDSAGKMVDIDYTSTLDNGYSVVNAGRFILRYKPTGEIRFERNKGFVSFIPAFDTTDVGVEFNIHAHGLKANYYLDKDSPNRLAWGFGFTSNHEKEVKGKGRIRNTLSKVVAELGELKAWDATGRVVDLTVDYTKDSLTVLIDTAGAAFPITLDPTVQDTLVAAMSGQIAATSEGSWAANRDLATGTTATAWGDNMPTGPSSSPQMFRVFMSFDMVTLSAASTVDTVKFFWSPRADRPTDDTAYVKLAIGSWTGTAIATSWYSLFLGRATSAPHTPVYYSADSAHSGADYPVDGWRSIEFSAAGRDTLKAKLNADTLRIAVLEMSDIANTISTDKLMQFGNATHTPYLYIITDLSPPTLSHVTTTADDSLYVTALNVFDKIVVSLDSVGGGLDSVGAAWVVKGQTADTIWTVTDSASGGTWTIADSTFVITSPVTDTLDIDTLYNVTAFSVTGATRTFSDVVTEISTYLTASTVAPSTSQIVWTVVELAASVTAFGTTPVTVRGIAYFLNQEDIAADVDTALDAGSSPFAAGVYSLEVTVPADTFVIYRGIATTVTGDAVSVWDTLRTTAAGATIDGVPITVMGLEGTRSVN